MYMQMYIYITTQMYELFVRIVFIYDSYAISCIHVTYVTHVYMTHISHGAPCDRVMTQNDRSLLQKSPRKETVFCERDLYI